MKSPSYPAARVVAERIGKAFQDSADAVLPDVAAVEEIISAAFWASLQREEGRVPKISFALVSPEQITDPLTFETRIPLESTVLARLAPAVERPGIHLGVWWQDGQLCVWGTTRALPISCFVLEVVAPGLLVVKYRRPAPSTKFSNFAVLEGATVKFLEQKIPTEVESPPVLQSLLRFYSSAGRHESDNILVRLAMSIRAHGRGGTLLVVPADSDRWRGSIVQPVPYSVTPPFSTTNTTQGTVDALGGLTAVDGATIMSDHFDLYAFGAKIVARDGGHHVDEVILTEPIENHPGTKVEPSQLGGTRHLSAAQFVNDQRDCFALVASQDGRFTVFSWSRSIDMVHARRFEALLI